MVIDLLITDLITKKTIYKNSKLNERILNVFTKILNDFDFETILFKAVLIAMNF